MPTWKGLFNNDQGRSGTCILCNIWEFHAIGVFDSHLQTYDFPLRLFLTDQVGDWETDCYITLIRCGLGHLIGYNTIQAYIF